MRCDIHPGSDAVGTCIYCGRGVCDQCKVRLYDKIHCKECVEAGRIRGAPEPQAPPQQGPPGAPPSMGYPGYPGYPGPSNIYMTPVIFKQPKPHGIPRKGYFLFGMVSCFACMVMSFIVAFLMADLILFPSYEGGSGSTDSFIVAIFALTFFLYPVLISFLGFYKNYGSAAALMTVIGGFSMLPIYQFLWGYYTFMTVFHSNHNSGIDTFSLVMFPQLILGGVLLMATMSLRSVSFFMVPQSEGRRATVWAMVMMIAATIAFFCIIGIYIVGWILLGLALAFMGNMFMKAPVPDVSGAVQMPQGPMMMPPPLR